MQNRTIIFWCVLVFTLAVQAFVLWFGGWGFYKNMDNILHFFYGLSIFLFFIIFRKWKPLDTLLLVLAFQFFWEAGELITDQLKIHAVASIDYRNYFFFDGLKDTIVDGLGALLGWLIIKIFPRDNEKMSKLRIWMITFVLLMIPMIVFGSIVTAIRGESQDMLALIWILSGALASIIISKLPFFRQLSA